MKYNPVDLLHVELMFSDSPIPVGRLALQEKDIWFEYDRDFISLNFELSPFALPLDLGAKRSKDPLFSGLFGVFDDSLPDGWGRLLLDRQLNAVRIPPEKLSPLDRLAWVGNRGMGALTYQPAIQLKNEIEHELNLDRLAEESHLILEGDSHVFFSELLALNGSSNGVRPKIVARVSHDKKHIRNDAPHLLSDDQPWIIKFPSSLDPKDIGAIEFAYSNMAHAAGVEMAETYLFPHRGGCGYFGSQRFDRQDNMRLHMHTLGGLIHSDYRSPCLDYADLLKVTYSLTKNISEVQKAYQLAVFNVLAHNRDDHCKNFSFLMDSKGVWRFAPAYDLTYSHGPRGEQSMLVLGEGKNPSISHLTQLGKTSGIHDTSLIIERTTMAIQKWNMFAEEAGVSRVSKEKIGKALQNQIG